MDNFHSEDSPGARIARSRLAVDPKSVLTSAPLTPEEVKTANRWKTRYVLRLKKENVRTKM